MSRCPWVLHHFESIRGGGLYLKTCPSFVHELRDYMGNIFWKMNQVELLVPTIIIRNIDAIPIKNVTADCRRRLFDQRLTMTMRWLMTDLTTDMMKDMFRVLCTSSESETAGINVEQPMGGLYSKICHSSKFEFRDCRGNVLWKMNPIGPSMPTNRLEWEPPLPITTNYLRRLIFF